MKEEEKNYWSDEEIQRINSLFEKYYLNLDQIEQRNVYYLEKEHFQNDTRIYEDSQKTFGEVPASSEEYIFIKEYLSNPPYLYNLTAFPFSLDMKEHCDPFLSKHLYNNIVEDNLYEKRRNGIPSVHFKSKKDLKTDIVLNKNFNYYYFYLGRQFLDNVLYHAYKNIDYHKNIIFPLSIDKSSYGNLFIGKDFVISYNDCNTTPYIHHVSIYVKDLKKLPDGLKEVLIFEDPGKETAHAKISYLYIGEDGILEKDDMKIKETHFDDIKENYNDDIIKLNKNVADFINEESSGLAIFHGIPGTGKTYYIRSIIDAFPDKEFTYISETDFMNLCDNKRYLIKFGKNNVFIMEDCEMLLMKRDKNVHNQISDILNIADGMLGDSINLKIICTFNTNTYNIDEALLRKGRIKIDYEFRELSSEKSKALCKVHHTEYTGKPMPLCDIYKNSKLTNEEQTEHKKIGFN